MWEDVGRYLSGLSPPMALEFSPEQMRDPKKMIECSRKVCPDLLWGWLCPSDALRTIWLCQEEANASGPGPLVQAPQLNQGQAVPVSAVPVFKEKQWI